MFNIGGHLDCIYRWSATTNCTCILATDDNETADGPDNTNKHLYPHALVNKPCLQPLILSCTVEALSKRGLVRGPHYYS